MELLRESNNVAINTRATAKHLHIAGRIYVSLEQHDEITGKLLAELLKMRLLLDQRELDLREKDAAE